jgi:hypothetical protein
MMNAAAEIAIIPPMTPPTTAPTLEEPLDFDEGVEVAVEAMGREDRVTEDHGVFNLSFGPVSGVSEGKGGSIRRPNEGKICFPTTDGLRFIKIPGALSLGNTVSMQRRRRMSQRTVTSMSAQKGTEVPLGTGQP